MALSRETKRLLILTDFFLANTWRYLLKSLWLFFPPLIFLLLAYFVLWNLVQGKDLMVITWEVPDKVFISWEYACFILALVFWVYVTWYATRLVANAKDFEDEDDHPIWEIFKVQTPRVLAFTCITIVLLAFAQLPVWKHPFPSWLCYVLLILSFPFYFYTYHFWTLFLGIGNKSKTSWLKFLSRVRAVTFAILAAGFLATILLRSGLFLVIYIFCMQVALVLLMILRRELDEARNEAKGIDKNYNPHHVHRKSALWKKFKHLILDDQDRSYFRGFKWISLIAFIIYVAAISSVTVSVIIGSFPFLLLAFGVLLGIGNFISFISVLTRFNFHFLIFVIALICGQFNDSHFATVVDKENPGISFDNRKDLRQYFTDWLNDSTRRKILDTTTQKYPVYFVMANGGASRSGYWTASILTGLEYASDNRFSRHLFCLSGASGGSVGTATFFSLLRSKKELEEKKLQIVDEATHYLQTDFLTYTLSHLLGPDIFRHFLPFLNYFTRDRAAALAHAMEKAPDRNSFLYEKMAAGFSSFITQKGQTQYDLPILCINTTQMQDASPAVISNIRIRGDNIRNNYFNNRIDVLDLLNEKEDLKLSTAVVLGASFPYISPAGRINSKRCDTCSTTSHYFVDGGYFDNSGAGVVNEMIIAMNNMMNDKNDTLSRYRDKLEFFVIHISNTDPKNISMGQINPMTNDLLAPLKTLMGSYGTQTAVNDQRLKSYLFNLYRDSTHYTNIELYSPNRHSRFCADSIKYSMNWVISELQLNSMSDNLKQNDFFLREAKKITGLQ